MNGPRRVGQHVNGDLHWFVHTRFSRVIARLLVVALLLVDAPLQLVGEALAQSATVFGPEDFLRKNGAPQTVTRTFSVANPTGPHTLCLVNGGQNGQYPRVSSAVVTLNGSQMLRPNDFSQNVGQITRAVTVRNTNTLTVEVRSQPGSGFTLSIVRGTSSNCGVPANRTPIANSGPDQSAPVNTTITLDGSQSSDVDGDSLTYQWSFVSKPAASTATLTNPTAVKPTFVLDKPGDYALQLIVNDGTVNSDPDTVVISTVNSQPVANAGPDQSATVTSTVTLDGSGSTDIDGDTLTHQWSLTAPAGSTATLSSATAVMPTFVLDKPGTYTAQLIVNDGTINSDADTVVISTENSKPVADAGNDQTVPLNAVVNLNGNDSNDVDGDTLTYLWTLLSKPTDSTATLSSETVATPTFTVDKPGTYTAQLIVNDGTVDSDPDTVVISTQNSKPVADAGEDQTSTVNQPVQLDGSDSTDADNDPLTYQWSFTTTPPNSTATLSDQTIVNPTFTPDQPGLYIAQLIVSDGNEGSDPDTTSITINVAPDLPPVADAGPDQTVNVNATVQLDGSQSSDPDNDPLSFQWEFSLKPADSQAIIQNPTTATPSFTADKAGTYTLKLTVNDGRGGSASDFVTITATRENHLPEITSTPVTTATATQLYTYDVDATDPDAGDVLTYSLNVKPEGMTIDPTTGLIQWTPTAAQVGNNAVTVRVTDTDELFAEQSFTVTVTPPTLVCIEPPSGLVAWLPGDGNANEIQARQDGAPQQGATFALGMVGQAFSLNGVDQSVLVPDHPNQYPGTGSFTVDAWIKTSVLGDATVVGKYECDRNFGGFRGQGTGCFAGSNSGYELFLDSFGHAAAFIRDSDTARGGLLVAGATVLTDGAFHHLAMARDIAAGELRLYVDGALEARRALNATSDGAIKNDDLSPDDLFIGALFKNNILNPEPFFSGLIDEVQLFNRALNDTEVETIFNAGSGGQCKAGRATPGCAEGLACATGFPGICSSGHTTCPSGFSGPTVCEADRAPVEEVCGSGTDDDCDGETDEASCRTDGPPTAEDDAYDVRAGETLNVSARGVLANDSDAEGDPLTARLARGPMAGTLSFNPDGSFAYTPDPVSTGNVNKRIDLTRLQKPTARASSSQGIFPPEKLIDGSLDGSLNQKWIPSNNDLRPFAELTFNPPVTVREIRYFASFGSTPTFTAGSLDLYDSFGNFVFTTGEIPLPPLNGSIVVDVEGSPSGPVVNVARLRFLGRGVFALNRGVAEIQVFGDGVVPPQAAPAEVNLAELFAVALNTSSFQDDFHRPEAANDDHPDTRWFAANTALQFYEIVFPVDVTATRIEALSPGVRPEGFDTSNQLALTCFGKFQLFDKSDVVLFDTGEVKAPAGINGTPFTAPVPNVGGVRRLRYTQTQGCGDQGGGVPGSHPVGFTALRLFGSPSAPAPRLDMFKRFQSLALNAIHSTPLVTNLTDDNGDGKIDRNDTPDIVAIIEGPASQVTGTMKVVSGDDGRELFTAGAANSVSPWSEPAVGDIDGDGLPEIVAVHSDGSHLIAFENDGAQKWLSDAHTQPNFFAGATVVTGAVAIANLDGAGLPEIIVGAAVYDAKGKLLGDGAGLGGTSGGGFGVKRSAISVVSDLDLDGVPELVAGPTAYQLRSGGLVKVWQRSDRPDGFAAVGNFDADPEAEIVIVANGQVYMLNHDGSDAELWNPPSHAPIPLPGGGSGGAPTIGDFDGDGGSEIGIAGLFDYMVFERDGSVLWQTAIMDYSSHSTGSTVFDFEQDGSVEVIYRDERFLRVYRGKDGLLLAKQEIHSATWTEEPVVADVDGDGDAEIIVCGDLFRGGGRSHQGIHVFEDPASGWAPTRRIWNQHSYHITNVNEDGTIPRVESTNWLALGLNNFRLNTFGPDDVRDSDDSFTYHANDGALDSAEATVRIHVQANRPPTFTSTPPTSAFAGQRYTYAAQASDSDPGDVLTFSLPLAPTGMTIDSASGLIGWTPTADQIGDQNVTVRVQDGAENVVLQKYVVTVSQSGSEDVDNDGDGLSENQGDCDDTNPNIRPGILDIPGDGIDQDCSGADAVDPLTTDDDGDGFTENQGDCNDLASTIFPGAVDVPGDGIDQDCTGGDGDDPSAADADGDGFSVAFGDCNDADPSINPGAFDVPGDGIDQNCNGVDSVAGDNTPPTVSLDTPADLAEVTAPTDIVGTADDANFLRYKLEFARVDDTAFTTIGSGTTRVTNGALGRLDPTLLENGLYRVLLTAEDVNGQKSFVERVYAIAGEMKVGNFTLSFVDLNVPVSGIPIQVVRTYDSRVKTQGDFGIGWSLEIKNGKYQHNRLPGQGWIINDKPFLGDFLPCIGGTSETRSHFTEVRLSDREVYSFALKVESGNLGITGACEGTASFRFLGGTTPGATLEILDGTSVIQLRGGADEVLDMNAFLEGTEQVYNPRRVRLTTIDGRKIEFDRTTGITRIEDLNGNALSITAGGVIHSSGKSIVFSRDAQGRILRITDPKGNTLNYGYDASGDLTSFIDQADNQTTFIYNAHHNLLEIHDPLGNRAVQSEYDADGRLIAVVDTNGNRVVVSHDLDALQEVITDRLGNVSVVQYDARGNLTKRTDALGHATIKTYDSRDNILTDTNELGEAHRFTYDGHDNLLTETDPLSSTTTHTYSSRNQELSRTDARGDAFRHTYDRNGNLLTETDALGNTTTYTYDAHGNRLSATDPLGAATSHQYDTEGREISKTTPGGALTLYDYDANGQKIREIGPDGAVQTFAYDGLGNITAHTDPLGSRTLNEYDALGRRTRQIDPLGGSRTVSYDEYGRQIAETDAAGGTTAFIRDVEGRIVQRTDPDGHAATYEYDPLGRLVHSAVAGVVVEGRTYDAAGRLIRVADGLGNATTYTYDAAGRKQTTTFSDGATETDTHDAVGNVLTRTGPLGVTRFTYDAMNQVTARTDPDGQTIGYTYDAFGQLRSVVRPDGTSVGMEYDSDGRIARVTDSLGNIGQFSHDGYGRRVRFVDPLGRATSYSYDGRGFPASRVVEGIVLEQYANNAMGWLTARTDADGRVTNYEYDGTGRVTRVTYPDSSTLAFTYTPVGRRATATDAHGTTRYAYDANGRLSAVVSPDGMRIEYRYDATGGLVGLVTPAGETAYERDAWGRITAVVDPTGGRYRYVRDAAGLPVSLIYPNGVEARTVYDANGRAVERIVLAPGGAALARFTVTRDVVGRAVQVDERGDAVAGSVVRSYLYDADLRLVRAAATRNDAPEDDQAYTLDAFGNRTRLVDDRATTNTSYDTLDRLVSSGDRSFTYDAAGRLTQIDSPRGATTYAYDFENRLRQVVLPGLSQPITYEYDADGNRVARTQGLNTVHYVLDLASPLPDVLLETNAAGAILTSYLYADNQLLAVTRGGVTSYVHADAFGHIRLLSDTTGGVTDTFEYDGFGNPTIRTGSTDLPYRFGGQRYDEDTGLYYLRARYYDPTTGRFLTPDPAPGDPMRPISFNRYLYAMGDPVNMVDPSGLTATSLLDLGAGFAGVSALLTQAVATFTGLLASVKVQLFVAGAITAGVTAAVATHPAAQQYLQTKSEALNRVIAAAAALATCGLPLFHYTNQVGAAGILATQEIFASPAYTGDGFTHPVGAYATAIPPVGPTTQGELQALYKKGNPHWDVRWFVMLCSNVNTFIPSGYPAEFYSPAPYPGFPVPVRTYTAGPNLMLP